MSEVELKPNSNSIAHGSTSKNTGSIEHAPKNSSPGTELSLRFFREEAEMLAISGALNTTNWNRKRAAQLLRISYRGLLYKIRRHNLAPPGRTELGS